MGWVDGYGPQLATVFAAAWPGLREHLEQLRIDSIREAGVKRAEAEEARKEQGSSNA